jgi:hypothetical protein
MILRCHYVRSWPAVRTWHGHREAVIREVFKDFRERHLQLIAGGNLSPDPLRCGQLPKLSKFLPAIALHQRLTAGHAPTPPQNKQSLISAIKIRDFYLSLSLPSIRSIAAS